ncbi:MULTISPECIES: DUF397 domain-containing protein [Actinoalloteichus]|uniref:DUF397 family protein n=1 Tax=Actinoalloteichus fjordicus TaxID=1612552 RepID=A0AAC9PRT2_9PSEU|nr:MULTISPECIES: DUF397 domain-containing protein [Actinoalloteichus]APU14302.1 putative DUF397 family protein [Actinoalloteichus fjordicus]APU20271.1 putative DUF397 family protein [Actinoalloteichus sp. GBA129-24]
MPYDTGWFTSSRTTPASNNCVEVRMTEPTVFVRDSKNPGGGVLAVTPAAWAAFLRRSAG